MNQIVATHIENEDAQIVFLSKFVDTNCIIEMNNGDEYTGRINSVRFDSGAWSLMLHRWNDQRMIFDPMRQKILYLKDISKIILL